MREKCGHSMDNGFVFKKINKREKNILGVGPFRIYQLISIAVESSPIIVELGLIGCAD